MPHTSNMYLHCKLCCKGIKKLLHFLAQINGGIEINNLFGVELLSTPK